MDQRLGLTAKGNTQEDLESRFANCRRRCRLDEPSKEQLQH